MLIHKHSCRWLPSQRAVIFRVSSNFCFGSNTISWISDVGVFFFSSKAFVCLWITITSFSVQGTWVSRTASSPQGCGTWQSWSECHRVSSYNNTFRLRNQDKNCIENWTEICFLMGSNCNRTTRVDQRAQCMSFEYSYCWDIIWLWHVCCTPEKQWNIFIISFSSLFIYFSFQC